MMGICSLAQEGCNNLCDNDGKCLSRMDLMVMGDLRMQFWGGPNDPVKGPKDRALSIKSIFEDYHEYNVIL